MHPALLAVLARPWPPGTLCCLPAIAWLARCGIAAPDPATLAPLPGWEARFLRFARAAGLERTRIVHPGDLVLYWQPATSRRACGLAAPGGFVAATCAEGGIVYLRAYVARAWSVPCPR